MATYQVRKEKDGSITLTGIYAPKNQPRRIAQRTGLTPETLKTAVPEVAAMINGWRPAKPANDNL